MLAAPGRARIENAADAESLSRDRSRPTSPPVSVHARPDPVREEFTKECFQGSVQDCWTSFLSRSKFGVPRRARMCIATRLERLARISRQRDEYADERWVVFHQRPNTVGVSNAAAIAAAQQPVDFSLTRLLHITHGSCECSEVSPACGHGTRSWWRSTTPAICFSSASTVV